MRFDIRLHGTTASDRKCVMECTVYPRTEDDLQQQVEKCAQEGPWFYTDGNETVAETEQITVLHVQRLVNGKWE